VGYVEGPATLAIGRLIRARVVDPLCSVSARRRKP
jgi:hypothetical protein